MISDAAVSCIGCGRPMPAESKPLPQERVVSPADGNGTVMACKECGGFTFKKYSLLYEEQRATSEATTVGSAMSAGQGGVRAGIGFARTTGVHLSDLARRVAPPKEEAYRRSDPSSGNIWGALLLVSVATFWFGTFWIALIVFVLGFFAINFVRLRDKSALVRLNAQAEAYRTARRVWERKYLCTQCGCTELGA